MRWSVRAERKKTRCWAAVKYFKWGGTQRRVKAGVVAEFGPSTPWSPFFRKVTWEATKIHFHNTVNYLCLAVRLRILSRCKTKLSLVRRNSSFRNPLVNVASLSHTMDSGSPWSLKRFSKNIRATSTVVQGCDRATNFTEFENLPTTTNITFLLCDKGSPSIKSIEISIHTCCGTIRGCSKLDGFKFSVLLR